MKHTKEQTVKKLIKEHGYTKLKANEEVSNWTEKDREDYFKPLPELKRSWFWTTMGGNERGLK
jgi:hypothetical protein